MKFIVKHKRKALRDIVEIECSNIKELIEILNEQHDIEESEILSIVFDSNIDNDDSNDIDYIRYV